MSTKKRRGRPSLGGRQTPRRNVGISDEHWQQLRDLGDGNATAGIRIAIAALGAKGAPVLIDHSGRMTEVVPPKSKRRQGT